MTEGGKNGYKIESEKEQSERKRWGIQQKGWGGEGNFFKGHILYCKAYLSSCVKCYHCKSCSFYK